MGSIQEEYQRKLISPEEAVKVIKSGDRVAFAYGMEPLALGLALVARKEELKGVKLFVPAPGRDFPWYEPGWEDSFQIEIAYILPLVRETMAEGRADYLVSSLFWAHELGVRKEVDVLLIQLSPPNEHGF